MKKIYYAHPITTYGMTIEWMDVELLKNLGFEVVNPNTPELDTAYKERGMGVFLELVRQCDALAFRGFSDGKIPAGVHKEAVEAIMNGLPVFEMPAPLYLRKMTVEETRERLKELGRK